MKRSWRYVPLGIFALLLAAVMFLRYLGTEQHSVTLTWQAPVLRSGLTLVGYNVYRRTAEGGSFVKIADKVSGPPYEDRLVGRGRRYVYVVTSVDKTGRESRFSAEAKAEIP